MGKSSGWIYEGHAPLMAKRQGRRGEKRRRLVGGAVILALTIAVFAFARSSSGPDDEESLGWGDSPGDDDFDVPARRFGAGGSHGAHAAVRPHRFNGDDAHGADAMHATHSAMDSMNSLSLGSAIDNHPSLRSGTDTARRTASTAPLPDHRTTTAPSMTPAAR